MIWDFQPPEVGDNAVLLFTHPVGGIFYGSPRNLRGPNLEQSDKCRNYTAEVETEPDFPSICTRRSAEVSRISRVHCSLVPAADLLRYLRILLTGALTCPLTHDPPSPQDGWGHPPSQTSPGNSGFPQLQSRHDPMAGPHFIPPALLHRPHCCPLSTPNAHPHPPAILVSSLHNLSSLLIKSHLLGGPAHTHLATR